MLSLLLSSEFKAVLKTKHVVDIKQMQANDFCKSVTKKLPKTILPFAQTFSNL